MKPVQILLLVLAGALGGAMLMKVVQRPGALRAGSDVPAPLAEVPVTPASAPVPVAAPATKEEAPAVQDAPPIVAEQPAAVTETRPVARPQAPPKPRVAEKKPSPMPPPPAHPRPLIVAQVQPPTAPAVQPQPASPPTPTPAVQESPMPPPPPVVSQPENVTPPAPPQPEVHSVTLNAGMLIPVRLVDGLSSERNSPGDPFTATLYRELVVDGWVIAEKGARVEGRVVSADRGTKVHGGAALTVELIRLHTSDRQIVGIETDPFETHVQPNHQTDAEKVGAGAAIGAIIGALAGGGKGAAVGAGVGGGAGAGDVLLTRQPATLPSETRITFRLRNAVVLTERAGE
jgi:hypothetical protein